MTEEIIFAGFGGQGVILAGRLLCIAAMNEGKYVSHIPSYGAEMRGGTANCSVIISDEEVASPTVEHPSVCVILNEPSLTKFEHQIKKGGTLIYNSALIEREPERDDIAKIAIDANGISEANGSTRGANMAALGRLIKIIPELAHMDSLKKALDIAISARNKKFNPVNEKIMEAGYNS